MAKARTKARTKSKTASSPTPTPAPAPASSETSSAPYRMAMVVGAPRSGTTLLQVALGSNPGIATSRETHLFARYLGPMFSLFAREEADFHSADGIRNHLDRDALIQHFRTIAASVFSSIRAANPDASVVLEKTPGHLAHMKLIHACFPEMKFIHIVRDPRGVAASFKAASQESWGGWAKGGPSETGRKWTAWMTGARADAEELGASYRQIRYEDLFVDGAAIVNDLFQWLGLPPDPSLPGDLRDRYPVSEMTASEGGAHDPRVESRAQFFRRGDPEGWRDELSPAEIAAVERQCGEFMTSFGYVLHGKPFVAKPARLAGPRTSPMATMAGRLIETSDFVGYCDVDDKPFAAKGVTYASQAEPETDTNFVRLSNGAAGANSGGTTDGYSLRTPDAFEAAASGRRVAVSVIARAADAPKSRFALAYSTNDVGNSGWRWQEAGPDWALHSFEYDVPVMKDGNGDFVAVLPDAAGRPGVDVFLVAARVLKDKGD